MIVLGSIAKLAFLVNLVLTLGGIIVLAFLLNLALTPLVRYLAVKLDFVDKPDGHRKVRQRHIPLGGGIPVLLATLVPVVVALLVPNHWMPYLLGQSEKLLGLLLAAVLLCALGIVDDFRQLRGRHKLVVQIIAVAMMMVVGQLTVHRVAMFGWELDLGPFAIPFTLFWMLGAINALNLLDGVDGLAGSIGVIISVAIAGMALLTGHSSEAVVALALTGSLLGFLCFNLPPAKIFLGDAGSMLIGLIVGFLSIQASLKGPATVALAAPFAIFAIPIFDSGVAILRRKLTGRSIYSSDLGHLHHCLVRRGYSNVHVVWWIGILCACTAFGALISVYLQNEILAVACTIAILGTLTITKVFGYSEFMLLLNRVLSESRSFARVTTHRQDVGSQRTVHMHGQIPWENLWNELIEDALGLELTNLQLDVEAPLFEEAYHAAWQQNVDDDSRNVWTMDLPLIAFGCHAGQLKISGSVCEDLLVERIEQIAEYFQRFRERFLVLIDDKVSGNPEMLAHVELFSPDPHDRLLDDDGLDEESAPLYKLSRTSN